MRLFTGSYLHPLISVCLIIVALFPLFYSVLVSEVAHLGDVVPPVLLDLYPCLEIDLRAHEALDIPAAQLSYPLEHISVLADYYALVPGLFAVDSRLHVDYAVIPLGKARYFDSCAVRYFPLQAEQELFADYLRHYLLFRLIRHHIVREELGSLLGVLLQQPHKFVHALVVLRGYGHNGL